ncbi:MAG: energy transducer TonB [Thermodesulfovibrionales bacterium]|nr:energy transducer TonB [Thermodesulfovibrionales bacterium]
MIRNAFIISLAVHIILISIIFYLAKKEIKPKKEIFYADIVRPDEGVLKKDEQRVIETPPLTPQRPSKSSPRQKSSIPLVKKSDNYKQNTTKEETRSPKRGYDVAKSDSKADTPQRTSNEKTLPPQLPSTPSTEGSNQRILKEQKTFRERIFDKDVIKELAKADKPTPEKDGSITFDAREFKYHSYLKRLRERIESVWKYPQEAAERGIYGDLFIRFTIKKNGSIGDIEILRTSGHNLLDNAATKAIRDASPYWPVPDELGKESFTITGHFVYSIYGTFIR